MLGAPVSLTDQSVVTLLGHKEPLQVFRYFLNTFCVIFNCYEFLKNSSGLFLKASYQSSFLKWIKSKINGHGLSNSLYNIIVYTNRFKSYVFPMLCTIGLVEPQLVLMILFGLKFN